MKFIYTLSVNPLTEEDGLDKENADRFIRLMDIAVSGASADCGVRAELELITELP